jgi:hypothetical protein
MTEFQPIGIDHSPFFTAVGLLFQSIFSQAEETIKVFLEFQEFSHLILLSNLNCAGWWALLKKPLSDGGGLPRQEETSCLQSDSVG